MVDLTPSYAEVMNCLTDIARLNTHKIKTTKLLSKILRCVIPVVLGQWYKAVACVYLYIYIHTVMNRTILQLVAIYKVQLHVSALYVGHHQVVQRTQLIA